MAIDSKTFTMRAEDIPLVTDGIDQPTFYADNIRGSVVTPEVVKLNLVEVRVAAHAANVIAKHCCTIIVPRSQVRAWAKFLVELADDNGLPPLPPDSDKLVKPIGTAVTGANG